ncbi:MAG: response regulator [Proteobacteria bacterium]|nr:response regulator [Pseudomonadota bacterium]
MYKKDFKILVVDDDPIARDVVFSILSKEGYYVVSAQDGFQAIDMMRKKDFSLLITDLVMPGIDGIELIKSALKISPEIASVVMTAYGTLDIALKAIELGAYDYITKPFKIEEILFLVSRCDKMIQIHKENRLLKKILSEIFKRNIVEIDKMGDLIDEIEKIGFFTSAEVKFLKKRIEKAYGKA